MMLKNIVDFVEKSDAFDNVARLKTLLVACSAKPGTFIHFRVTPKNIDDKRHFERHLRELGLPFIVSRPKGYEEITSVKGGVVNWRFEGIWYGYDIFGNLKVREQFFKYKKLIANGRDKEAAVIGGEVYGYPKPCVRTFIKELDVRNIAKKYSYGQYFTRLHMSDRKYPFVQHMPCSQNCPATAKLNMKYRNAIKKCAPRFSRSFSKKVVVRVPLLINFENDLLYTGKTVWPKRTMHDYTAVTHDRVLGRYCLVTFLTKHKFEEGDLIRSKLTFQYNTVSVEPGRKIKHFRDVVHKRKVVKL